LMNESLTLH